MRIRITILFLTSIYLNPSFGQTGIGTTAPVNKFEVVNTTANPAISGSSANGHFRLGATVGDHVLDFGLGASSTYSWMQARNKTAYGTNFNLAIGVYLVNKIARSKLLPIQSPKL